MRLLADTSVWIDFFNKNETDSLEKFEFHIQNNDDICVAGIIQTEVLQGIKSSKQFNQIQSHLSNMIFLEMPRNGYVLSANIYRTLRQKGKTIKSLGDCLIASVAILNNVPLLHSDRDFDVISKYSNLIVL